MNLSIILSPQADRDVDEIIDWLANQSVRGASNWLKAYELMLERLQRFPEGNGQAEEQHLTRIDLKQVFFKTRKGKRYRAVYTIREDQLVILRIRSPQQNLISDPSEFGF